MKLTYQQSTLLVSDTKPIDRTQAHVENKTMCKLMDQVTETIKQPEAESRGWSLLGVSFKKKGVLQWH